MQYRFKPIAPGGKTMSRTLIAAGTFIAAAIVVAGALAAVPAAQAQAHTQPQRGSMSTVPPEVVKDLAPTGKLRAAINLGNSVLAQRDAAGAPKGITVDLARELGRRAGLEVELIPF